MKKYHFHMLLAGLTFTLALSLFACAAPTTGKTPGVREAPGTPGQDFVRTMLELYRDDNTLTRIQAMLLSVDLAPREELVQALREWAKHAADPVERAAAWYALAASTRSAGDIEGFLSAFLHSPRTASYFYSCVEWLAYDVEGLALQNFLTRLALNPAYRPKAMCALIAQESFITLPESSNLGWYGLVPTVEEAVCGDALSFVLSGQPFSDDIPERLEAVDEGSLFERLKAFDEQAVPERLLALMNSGDMETRVIIYLMQRNFPLDAHNPLEKGNALYARFRAGNLDRNEEYILHYALASMSFSELGSPANRAESRRRFISTFPEDRRGVESLLALERRTCRRYSLGLAPDYVKAFSNIATSVLDGSSWYPVFYVQDSEALRKLLAFLRYGEPYIDSMEYRGLASIYMRSIGFDDNAVAEAESLLVELVRNTYGWKDGEYAISLDFNPYREFPDSGTIFKALHDDDFKPPPATGGKSLRIDVDMKNMKILKVWRSQWPGGT